jgi:hypothetical protein
VTAFRVAVFTNQFHQAGSVTRYGLGGGNSCATNGNAKNNVKIANRSISSHCPCFYNPKFSCCLRRPLALAGAPFSLILYLLTFDFITSY